ncbi:MAG: hypothetical protein VR70_03040 [Rhodospirillaceae bacterium BRH_c57]|nr:MAG: hypothetical protein VR70_03040 [Rhodospirillaceae bacterium BRH_c57]
MTLSEVKAYLVDRRRAGLSDIAIHFGSSPDAVRHALRHWEDKGRVRVLSGGGSCSGSGAGCSCAKKAEDVFEWVP